MLIIKEDKLRVRLEELSRECENTIHLIKNPDIENLDHDKKGQAFVDLSLAITNLRIKTELMEKYIDEIITEIDSKE